MENIATRLHEIAEHAIKHDPSLFVVDVKVKGNSGNQKVLVFIDGDDGLNIDQCGQVSKKIGSDLEEMDIIPGKYTLEVSSPGLDHPLTLKRQYLKNAGRKIEVVANTGEKTEGRLVRVDEEKIFLDTGAKEKAFHFNEISKSNIIVSFK